MGTGHGHRKDEDRAVNGELLAHMFGDYCLQSDWMAAEKTNPGRQGWIAATAHAATYTACFLSLTRSVRALAVIGGTHLVIDHWRLAKHVAWLKNQAAPKAHRPGHTATGYGTDKPAWMAVWLMILTDNSIHGLINHLALRRWAE